ncbi:hypothetical protein KC336_g5758 [Hortaea werneckii]|nr:hypothetical protein KC336_g5758 [Hortaea werneckii]
MASRVQKAWSRNYEAEETSNRYRREMSSAEEEDEHVRTEWEEQFLKLLTDYCENPDEHSGNDIQAVLAPLSQNLLGYDIFQALKKEEQSAATAVREAEIARTKADEAGDRAQQADDELDQVKARVVAVEASNQRKAKRYEAQIRRTEEVVGERDEARKGREEAVNEAGELRVLLNEALAERLTAREEMLKARDERIKAEHASKSSAREADHARRQAGEADKRAESAAVIAKAREQQLRNEISEAQERLAQSNEKTEDLYVLNAELKADRTTVEDEVRLQMDASEQANANASRKQERIVILEGMLQSANEEIRDWRDKEQIDGLKLTQMERQLSGSQASELDMMRWLYQAEEKLGSLDVTVQRKDAQVAALESTVTESTNALEEARNKKSDLQARYDQQSDELTTKTSEIADLQSRLEQQHKEFAKASETLTGLQVQYDQQSKESKATTSELHEYSSKLHSETITRKAVEKDLAASREQRDRESLALSQEREALSQTQMALSEVRDELSRCKEEFKSQLEASAQRAQSQEARANDLQSQITVSSQDLSSLQGKYDLLKREALNHWEDMAAKDTALKDARQDLCAEHEKHQGMKASLEAKVQKAESAKTEKSAELHRANENISSLERENQKLLQKVSKAEGEIQASRETWDDIARQSQAETTKVNKELSETRTSLSALQHEKEQLLGRVRVADNVVDENKQQMDANDKLLHHYRTAFQDLVITASPDSRPADMSAQELTQSLRARNSAAIECIRRAKDNIELLTSQRDHLAGVLSVTLSTYVQTLSLCDEMLGYWESGMPTAAVDPSCQPEFPVEVGSGHEREVNCE